MKLVKITNSTIQIKSNSAEFAKVKINDLITAEDENAILLAKVAQLTDTETADSEDDYFTGLGNLKIIDCNILGSIVNGKFSKSIEKYPTSNVSIKFVSAKEFEKMIISKGFEIGKFGGYNCKAYVDGNKFFQKHACIVGNTGSGKSETLANILGNVSKLKSANVIVFDIHGEYSAMSYARPLRIGVDCAFPIWFFTANDIITNIIKLKEETATSVITAVRKCFAEQCTNLNKISYFDFDEVIKSLVCLNGEEVGTGEYYKTGDKAGLEKTAKGEFNGKLTSVISQFIALRDNERNAFLFQYCSPKYFSNFVTALYSNDKPVKVVDLSAVPHDIALQIIGVLTNLIYDLQLLSNRKHPITIACDEAHVYIPNNFNLSASQKRMVEIFETIAKEGRKFGVTLLVASQRPSELNRTIMAQCSNFIVGKLNNENDKQMMKAMLSDGADEIINDVTMYAPGEVVIIGDSFPITLKVKVDLAKERPISRSVNFWDVWGKDCNIDCDTLLERYETSI